MSGHEKIATYTVKMPNFLTELNQTNFGRITIPACVSNKDLTELTYVDHPRKRLMSEQRNNLLCWVFPAVLKLS